MNRKLPYEEAFERQMNDLPSQHEDESWQKMNKLLDKNDKHVNRALSKRYKILSILVFLLLTGIGLFIATENTVKEKRVAALEKTHTLQQEKLTHDTQRKVHQPLAIKQGNAAALKKRRNNLGHSEETLSIASNSKKNSLPKKQFRTHEEDFYIGKNLSKGNKSNQYNIFPIHQATKTKATVAPLKSSDTSTQNNSIVFSETPPGSQEKNEVNDPLPNIQTDQQDQLTVYQKDSSSLKEDIKTIQTITSQKTSLKRNKKYFVSAGIGVQQQVPVAGQKVVSIGYNATKNAFSDYIPSVYFRLERDQDWFLQGEFNYASPQLVKEFSYNRQTKADSSGSVITSLRLKKTFYNEIPISFNYYIRHNWSAGIGGVYSLFHGAITEKEIVTNNIQTQSVVKQIVPIAGYTDSFLYKSHMYLLLQTDYNWRRFSLGLRYTKDIQPYIKYTLPDGTINDQKNWSLKFILRCRLIKSARY